MRVFVASDRTNRHLDGLFLFLQDKRHEVFDFRTTPPYFKWEDIVPVPRPWPARVVRTALKQETPTRAYLLHHRHLSAADVVILALPAPAGMHLAAGYAMGAGIPTIIYAPDHDFHEPDLFYSLSLPRFCVTLRELERELYILESPTAQLRLEDVA